jgi:ribosomal protein L31
MWTDSAFLQLQQAAPHQTMASSAAHHHFGSRRSHKASTTISVACAIDVCEQCHFLFTDITK